MAQESETELTINQEIIYKNRLLYAFKDSCLAACVVFFLSVVILSFRITQDSYQITLVSRWKLTGAIVFITFLARFLLHMFVWKDTTGSIRVDKQPLHKLDRYASLKKLVSHFLPNFGVILVAFAISLPFLPFVDRYLIDLSILILTYIMLGWGLNIVVGLAGLLDLGYVAFYAVGAYSYALLSTSFFPWMIEQGYLDPGVLYWVFWICFPVAGVLAALWGMVLGFSVLRLRGDYLAIVTLAFSEIVRLVILNWHTFTGGPSGISRIPRPSFFGINFTKGDDGFAALFSLEYSSLHRIIFFYYLILALALLTNFVTLRLRRLPIGRAWEALREDETACRSLGINTTNTKLTAFAIGAMFGGIAGSFFATRQGFISPESFVFMESAIILSIVVLGGLGSQIGVAIAAIVMIGGIEAAREFHFLKILFGDNFDPSLYRMLIFGIIMVLLMIWKPRGFILHRNPSVCLKTDQLAAGGTR